MSAAMWRRGRYGILLIVGLALAAALVSLAISSADGRRVYFVIGCLGSVYQPKTIAISCADGKVSFRTNGWEEWGSAEASTRGTLSYPELCGPGGADPLQEIRQRRIAGATATPDLLPDVGALAVQPTRDRRPRSTIA